jgi:hypothetical protein
MNDIMDQRNKIAHPTIDYYFPDIEKLRNHIGFFNILSKNVLEYAEIGLMEFEQSVIVQPEEDGKQVVVSAD